MDRPKPRFGSQKAPAATFHKWVMLRPVSPMDRPEPTENKQTPRVGVALRRARRVQTPPPGDLEQPERAHPTATRPDGGVMCLGEKHMKHFCVDTKIKPICLDRKIRPICLELKVCEGCGALWIRARNHGAYCRQCAVTLSDFPPPRGRSRAGRKPKLRLAVCEGVQK